MPYVETSDGAKLFYKDWGQGRPVVLIHGWPLNSDMWEYQMVPLANRGLRTIAYDRRGFGRSSQTWTGYDYDTLADDLAALLDNLDLNDVVLVGFSMGAGEVARYLARHGGGRVAKAVLLSGVTPGLAKSDANPDGLPRVQIETMDEQLRKDRPAFLGAFGKLFFGSHPLNFEVSSDVLTWSQALALQGSPKATLDCLWSFAETDFTADVKAITVPTLIIHGDADKPVPIKASGERAAAMLPHAEYKVYEGAPHALFFTEAERLNADLATFALS